MGSTDDAARELDAAARHTIDHTAAALNEAADSIGTILARIRKAGTSEESHLLASLDELVVRIDGAVVAAHELEVQIRARAGHLRGRGDPGS